MTFFLSDPSKTPTIEGRQPPAGVSSFWEGLGAATTKSALENDANFKAARTRMSVRDETLDGAVERIGADLVWKKLGDRGLAPQVPMNDTARDLMRKNLSWKKAIREIAKEEIDANPDQYSDLDISEDAIEQKTNERLQAEYQDAIDTLEMMPSGRGVAELAGGMAGITADVKNLPFLFAGGGPGSLLRVAGREAIINATAELAFMPAQFKMAERLDIPDPDISTQILMAAGAGAAFGVGAEALGRGFRYFTTRNQAQPIPGYDPLNSRVMVDEAEDALASGQGNPFEEIAKIPERTAKDPPYRLENPINPERPPLILRPEDRIEVTPLPDNDPIISGAQEAIDALQEADTRAARPLAHYFANGHRRSRKKGAISGPQSESLQIDPNGEVGQELKARGITSRTFPGLFKKGGRRDVDNLVASEMEESFPGIIEATGTARGADYLDRDGLIDVLVRDAEGDSTWLRSRADAARMQEELGRYENARENLDPYLAGEKSDTPNSPFYTRDEVEFMEPADREVIMRDWFERSGYGEHLTPQMRREIQDAFDRDGGDPEFLIREMIKREQDFVEGRFDAEETISGRADGEQRPQDGQGAGEPEPVAGEAGSRAASEGTGNAGDRQSEITDAGEQLVTPGVDPVTQRQRLEAAQRAPMRGGNAAADDGLFDLGARAQGDMFDDVTSPEARVIQDAAVEDIRNDFVLDEDGKVTNDFDVEIDLPDGTTRTMKASEALDYLDEGDRFADEIALCGRPKGAST